jgi:hypothetical protein
MGYEHRKLSAQQRFANTYFVNDSGCWLWNRSLDDLGYGRISFLKNRLTAHRFSWIVHYGNIPDGMHVLHKCDVRNCVNPDHLYLGTHQQNMKDRDSRGRLNHVKGEKHPHAKLNEVKAFEIRWLAANGYKQRDLAKEFGVTQRAVAQIIHHKTWQMDCHD